MQTADHGLSDDFVPATYSVELNIEYLPGLEIRTRASVEFSDLDIARQALRHICRNYPGAKIYRSAFADVTPQLINHYKSVSDKTSTIRRHLSSIP